MVAPRPASVPADPRPGVGTRPLSGAVLGPGRVAPILPGCVGSRGAGSRPGRPAGPAPLPRSVLAP